MMDTALPALDVPWEVLRWILQTEIPGLQVLVRESWNGLGWEAPKAHPIPPLPWQGHLPLSQAAPSPMSNLALGTARDPGAATAALGTHSLPSPAHTTVFQCS